MTSHIIYTSESKPVEPVVMSHIPDPESFPEQDLGAWEELANYYLEMLHTAVQTGLRFRNKRGRWKWHIYPREYLAITRRLADAPQELLEAVREAELHIAEVTHVRA